MREDTDKYSSSVSLGEREAMDSEEGGAGLEALEVRRDFRRQGWHPCSRSSVGGGREGASSGLFGRQLEAPPWLRCMVKGITLSSSS